MKLVQAIIRKIRAWFVDRPNRFLLWTTKDFQWAKKWALTQPDPMGEHSSLWARIYSPRRDSVEILDEINRITQCK